MFFQRDALYLGFMIIHSPVRLQLGAEIQISVQVEMAGKKKRGQRNNSRHEGQASLRFSQRNSQRINELWFRFPAQFESEISREIDPFAVSLVLLAMKNREPILLEGSLSRKLFQGLKEYQRIYHSWYPEIFHEIEIQPTSLRDDPQNEGGQASCAFSGGVDSFFTLLTLISSGQTTGMFEGRGGDSLTSIKREGRNPKTESARNAASDSASEILSPPLGHALFMAGFDMPLHLTQSISELTDSYSIMMKELGIQFVVGSTNIRSFVNSVDWTNAHGQALAATALFFKDSWKQFYIPSSYTSASYPKWGTHPSLDHLLSTESLTFVHHGTESNRVNKLGLISQFPESYSRLRVCWIQDIGLKNCGECEKCVRTMVALDIQGKLSRYTTFGVAGLDSKNIRRLIRSLIGGLKMRTHQSRIFARELIWEAAKRLKMGVCLDLIFSLLRREVFHRRIVRQKINVGKTS